jgi:hypothetical protein
LVDLGAYNTDNDFVVRYLAKSCFFLGPERSRLRLSSTGVVGLIDLGVTLALAGKGVPFSYMRFGDGLSADLEGICFNSFPYLSLSLLMI